MNQNINHIHSRLNELIEQLDLATSIRDEADQHRDVIAGELEDTRRELEIEILDVNKQKQNETT